MRGTFSPHRRRVDYLSTWIDVFQIPDKNKVSIYWNIALRELMY